LLPLIDELIVAGYRPGSVWADRGYCSNPLRQAILERGMAPQISRRRRPGDPLPDGQQPRHPKARGRTHHLRSRDPNARHRWVVERTNAWLRRFKRLTIRNEPNSQIYLAYLTLALTIILARAL
jgi:transposase